ncbi:MAG: UDP-glucose/GDP-mannose dehydrogenase family protein [Fimbriimonadales bacterium]|nr:UDP-glucose/GDP-mannose dehydrogenase family protein [Fimbriimonadales bacterium]
MKIAVAGAGYVGLVTGVVFADLGNEVVCVDVDPAKIDALRKGQSPFYEPGLDELLQRNLEEGRFTATTDLVEATRWAEVIFICVGTPPTETGEPDLKYVDAAAAAIGQALNGYKIVVNKSTVPVGTGDRVRRIIEQHCAEPYEFDVVSNPEFLREGSAVHDTLNPDRIVIGADNPRAAMKIVELYAPLERPMLITNLATAEIIKYAANTFLALKISFINAIADLCERAGADVTQVAKAMGYDSRIGHAFLQAGLGFGGSCFPKDVQAFAHTMQRYQLDPTLFQQILAINEARPAQFVERIRERLGGLQGRVVGLLGLAFKPNTDDIREARSLEVIRLLLQAGATVKAYDPVAMPRVQAIYPQVRYCRNAYEVAENADALALITEWNEFRQLNFERIRTLMRQPNLFDGRNLYDPQRLRKLGFYYYGVGRAADNGELKTVAP